jgi:hypothetical protein
VLPIVAPASAIASERSLNSLRADWLHPSRSFRPHTRWWWPASAVTREGITWQLEQMRAQGMGGVEVNLVWRVYAKGDIPFISPEWFAMVRHAIEEAARLDLELAIAFAPDWSLGGSWVEVTDRSKVLGPGWVDLDGPAEFDSAVPQYKVPKEHPNSNSFGIEGANWQAPDANQVVAGYGFDRYDAAQTELASWTNNDRTKYFSGTGVYETSLDLPAQFVREDSALMLDLGQVSDIAEVEWNGKPAGVAWMQPYRLDVTRFARAGRNTLRILVTNTPQNYVTGLRSLPDVPENLQPHYGPTITPKETAIDSPYVDGFRAWQKKDKALTVLPLSGLIGPVRLISTRVGNRQD